MRSYKDMTDPELAEAYLGWSTTLDQWREFASQYSDDRRACRNASRGLRRWRLRRAYRVVDPEYLIESCNAWHAQLGAWAEHVSQHGSSPAAQHSLRRILRNIRWIESAARRRRLVL
jgi:hypothetical protein